MRTRLQQRGLTTVEFAIVGLYVVMLLFAILELGRVVFTLNVLQEGARRAARVAAVCAVGNAAVADAGRFMSLPGLETCTVEPAYLDQNGQPTADFATIRYVRVSISGCSIPLAFPFVNPVFDAPAFSSTLPRESLGVPKVGVPPAC
jgi:hypothetical protein